MVGTSERLQAMLDVELEALVVTCARGDAAAWHPLLDAVRRLAVTLGCRNYRLGLDDAEDLAQNVQLRVIERLPHLRRSSAFPLWVRRVIHHVALDTLRERRRVTPLDDLEDLDTDAESLDVDSYDRALLRADLSRALSRLPAHYRQPIEMHLLHGMPQEQISQRLGRPRSTVATQIERGLRRLRPMLASSAEPMRRSLRQR
jgi:RNA polymerase sigma factor (sigma-70 family)